MDKQYNVKYLRENRDGSWEAHSEVFHTNGSKSSVANSIIKRNESVPLKFALISVDLA